MFTSKELITAWESANLYRFHPELLDGVDIPQDAKSFLIEVGLPKKAEVPYRIYFVPLPEQPEDPPIQAATIPLLSPYLPLNSRYLAYFHYDYYFQDELYFMLEEESGYIKAFSPLEDPMLEDANNLINCSVSQLSESLLAFRDFISHFDTGKLDRSLTRRLIQELEQKWREIDPVAMGKRENYWPRMVYDLGVTL